MELKDISDLKVKHLEMIEANVSRMAGYSASLKNYCLTLLTAIGGFAITEKSPFVLLLGFLTVILFALLDAEYLRLEKSFRYLYDRVRRKESSEMPDFQMDVRSCNEIGFWSGFLSWSIWGFYVPIFAGVLIVLLALGLHHG